VEKLKFLLHEKLVTPRGKCGSAVQGTLEDGALASLCWPWRSGCDAADPANLKAIGTMRELCRTMPCPGFHAALGDAKRRINAVETGVAAKLLGDRDAFVAECFASRLGTQERRARFGGLFELWAVPVRYNLDSGGGRPQMPASYESMEECSGAPASGFEEWGWVVPAVPRYGVAYCVPIPAERRTEDCRKQWAAAQKRSADLRRFDAALP
jgi:hypothetical protein